MEYINIFGFKGVVSSTEIERTQHRSRCFTLNLWNLHSESPEHAASIAFQLCNSAFVVKPSPFDASQSMDLCFLTREKLVYESVGTNIVI